MRAPEHAAQPQQSHRVQTDANQRRRSPDEGHVHVLTPVLLSLSRGTTKLLLPSTMTLA